MTEPIISIKNLSFSYPDGHPALKDINLEIGAGEIFGIIGPTGAGKSTLLQHLNGILKGKGEITINGLRMEKKNDALIRERVGMVFQNPDDQLFCPTVYEDIAFGLYNLGFDPRVIAEKVAHILDQMNLRHLRDESSHHLSFGEKKRVALATTLVMNPLVLALDEPFANLDYRSILILTEMIRALPLTRVIISQDILLALSLCDRIALMDHGEIILSGPPEKIAANYKALEHAGLDYRRYVDIIRNVIEMDAKYTFSSHEGVEKISPRC